MIFGAQDAGALQGPEIADRLDHDDHAGVPARVGADAAGIGRVDIAADRTGDDFFLGDAHGLGQRPEQFLALADEMQRGAARRARPEPGQARQQLDQPFDLRPGDAFRHVVSLFRRLLAVDSVIASEAKQSTLACACPETGWWIASSALAPRKDG
jgi:hypothetical protein